MIWSFGTILTTDTPILGGMRLKRPTTSRIGSGALLIGYHLDGKMFAVVEGGMSFYTITVDGDKVTSEEFIPDATYVDEFYACEESEDT